MVIRKYQLLDVGLVVEAPPGAFLETFHQDYGRFEVPELPEANRLSVRYEASSQGSSSFLDIDGVRESLVGHPLPERYAAQTLAGILMERVAAFTILHAAVVASPEGALALSGPSGAGKTTLALALLKQGWAYYSDDFCPLHRETGWVHPFPRSLWVKAKPGEVADNQRMGKVLYPLDGKGCVIGGAPLPLKWLICLGAEIGRGQPGIVRLQVHLRENLGEPLLEELRGMDGTTVHPDPADSLRWMVCYPRGLGHTQPVMECLRRYRAVCWNVFTLPEPSPDFSQEPSLRPISAHEAAFFLLQELKHHLVKGGIKPGALLSHLGQLLEGVACFRLTPGPLDQCLALIQAALSTVEAT